VAAAALCELFPGIELLARRETSATFSCDFQCAVPLPHGAEILLEERMRQIVRERRPIQILEMVPPSARELFLKKGQPYCAEQMSGKNLVKIVQIGSFYEIGSGSYCPDLSRLTAYKLHPLRSLGGKIFSLSGCAFPSKGELQQFLKAYKTYPQKSHIYLGKKRSLWSLWNGQIVWLTAGLKIRRDLIDILRKNLFAEAIEISFPMADPRETLHWEFVSTQEKLSCTLAEIYWEPHSFWDPEIGLFAEEGGIQMQLSCYPLEEERREKLISFLQRIGETVNILGFQYRIRLLGKKRSKRGIQIFLDVLKGQGKEVEVEEDEAVSGRLDFLIKDQLGREWAAFSLELSAKGFFVISSVERLVALLLERTGVESKYER
jgi:hypothetical protein